MTLWRHCSALTGRMNIEYRWVGIWTQGKSMKSLCFKTSLKVCISVWQSQTILTGQFFSLPSILSNHSIRTIHSYSITFMHATFIFYQPTWMINSYSKILDLYEWFLKGKVSIKRIAKICPSTSLTHLKTEKSKPLVIIRGKKKTTLTAPYKAVAWLNIPHTRVARWSWRI